MEPSCIFGLEYTPARQPRDPVMEIHRANCPDCQRQMAVVSRDMLA